MSSEIDSDDDSNYTPEDHSDSEAEDQEENDKSDHGSDDSGSEEISTQPSTSSGRGRGQRGRPRGRRGVGGRGRSNSHSERKEKPKSWSQSATFTPDFTHRQAGNGPQQLAPDDIHRDWNPIDYFNQYVDNDLYSLISQATNQTAMIQTGHSLETMPEEIRKFFGVSIMMGTLKYPRIRMYWSKSTGVTSIKNAMKRDRFFKLRSHVKVVVDDDVPEHTKQEDKLWKVRPLLDRIRQTCISRPRPSHCCVDEQMIPFTGRVAVRQFVHGKPNPTGLKNFVLASPSGEVLDFEIFQGGGAFPDANTIQLSIGGLAVLRLTQTVPPNTSLFVDRYFTSVTLQDALLEKNISVTGTIMKNMIPKEAKPMLKSPESMKKEGRGSINQIVREDKKICIIQWFDNKEVLTASSEFGSDPVDICRRWSKVDNAYINVQRPAIIKQYNEKMGGVDLSDRMIAYYRMCARTKKWTVCTVLHMLDLCLANSWVQERQERIAEGKRKKELIEFLDFRLAVSENLLFCGDMSEDEDNDDLRPGEVARKHKAAHMPRMMSEMKNAARCRNPRCKTGKSRVICTTCKVFLCIRGCFEDFHR